MLKTILKEPLVHFLAIGILLFGLFDLVNQGPELSDRRIVISRERIRQLREGWAKKWLRPPTEEELGNLIEQFAREEVLYREAMAMGLDKDDTIIRRRMAQKVEFLVQDLTAPGEPVAAELQAFFERHPELFRKPARLSFTHVYFSTDRRGAEVVEEVQELRARLEAEGVTEAAERGDPFMLRHHYNLVTRQDVAREFGLVFAEAVFGLETGSWQGPVRSGYGVHLVRVSERVEAILPPFSEVREKVRETYLDDRRRRVNDEAIRRMKERYEIVVDEPLGNEASSVEAAGNPMAGETS